jgi:hypothetical protein
LNNVRFDRLDFDDLFELKSDLLEFDFDDLLEPELDDLLELELDELLELEFDELLALEFDELFELEFEELFELEFDELLELEFEELFELEFDELLPANLSNFSSEVVPVRGNSGAAFAGARVMLLMPPSSTAMGVAAPWAAPVAPPVKVANANASREPVL